VLGVRVLREAIKDFQVAGAEVDLSFQPFVIAGKYLSLPPAVANFPTHHNLHGNSEKKMTIQSLARESGS
jgi:hypothetical protein